MQVHYLYEQIKGAPWLLKVLMYVYRRSPDLFRELEQVLMLQDRDTLPVTTMIRFICLHLSEAELKTAQTLALLRHPVNYATLLAMTRYCHPLLSGDDAFVHLDDSLIKPLLKVLYPPQEVLEHVRARQQAAGRKFEPWYEFYNEAKKALYRSMPEHERVRVHQLLQDYYLQERKKPEGERVSHLHNKPLFSEAKFHGQMARARKTGTITKMEDLETGDWLGTKAYLSQAPTDKVGRTPTLDDYRSIQLPSSSSEPDEDALLRAWLNADDTALWDSIDLTTLELSDDEKRMLAQSVGLPKDTPAAALPPAAPAPAPQSLTRFSMSEEEADPGEKAIQQKLVAAAAAHDAAKLAAHLLELAEYRMARGLYAKAAECLEKALTLKKDASPAVCAEIYRLHGLIQKELYHHSAAEGGLLQALDLLRPLAAQESGPAKQALLQKMGRSAQALGEIAVFRKRHEAAKGYFTDALSYYEQAENALASAEMHFQLADLSDILGQPEAALAHYAASLALEEPHGNHEACGATLANMGSLHREAGREDAALACFERALTHDRAARNTEGQIRTLEEMADVYMGRREWLQAEVRLQEALKLAEQDGNKVWQAILSVRLGDFYSARGEDARALDYYRRAGNVAQEELSERSLQHIQSKIEEVARRDV